MAGDKVASLLVRIGANDQAVQSALASVGQKARTLDADLKKLGNAPLAGGAVKSLESLKSTMKQITDAQQRVAERGHLAALGIEQMGGASRLTESQLKQMNRTLQAGLESYRALGKDAPAELRRVADSVKSSVAGMAEPMSMIEKKAIALGTAVGTFLGNAALQVGREFIQAGKRAFDYADALSNLSATTDITVEGLQRIEALGVTSGVSLETLAASVGMLQKNLDNPAAINALGKMGLNYKEIRALKPEDQFIEIASAVAGIEDPVERANAGAALFGRQWQTIAPAIQGNIKEIVASVKTLSKEQIDALDEAGDAWDQFVKDSERGVTRFLGNLVLDAKKAELSLIDLLRPLEAVRRLQAGHFAREADPGFDAALKTVPAAPKYPRAAGPVIDAAGRAAKAMKEFDEAAERAKASAEKFKTVQDQLFGHAIIANAELLVRALGDDENLTRLTAEATKKLHAELGHAIDAYQALGRKVPPQLQDIYEKSLRISNTPIRVNAVGGPSLEGLAKTFITFGEVAQDGTLYARDFSNELNATQIQTNRAGDAIKVRLIPELRGFNGTMERAATLAEEMRERFKDAFGQIPSILREAFTGGGNLLGAMKAFGVQMADALTAPLLARLSGMATKWAGVLTGLAGAGVKSAAASTIPTIAGTAINVGAGVGGAAAGSTAANAGIIAGVGMNPATIAWTAGISAAVVGIYVGVKKLKEQRAHMEVNRLRDAFFDMKGGLEVLNPLVLEFTGNLDLVDTLFAAKNKEQWGQAVANINSLLEIAKLRFEAVQEAAGTVTEKLSGITIITPDLQTKLDNLFDQKTSAGYLTALKEINGELDKQAAKYDTIRGTLEKYGLEVTEAQDPVFRQQNTNASALTLRKDFDVLKGSGVDLNHAMEKMGPNLNKFVKEAKIAGVEVPEAMREVLQVAIDAGELFDRSTQKIGENGEALEANGEKWDDNNHKITDISQLGLTFGTTMETTMAKVETSIGRLALVLEGLAKFLGITLPKAAEDGAEKISDAFDDLDPVITPRVDWPKETWGYGGDGPVLDGAATGARVTPFGLQHLKGGGFARGTDTVPAMLTPGELVINAAQQANLAAALSAGAARPTLIIEHLEVTGVFSAADLKTTMVRDLIPAINAAWEDNANGSRTNTQDVLGIR